MSRFRRGRPKGGMRNHLDRGDPRKFRGLGLFVWLSYLSNFDAASGVWSDASGVGNNTTPQSATRPTSATGINGRRTTRFPGSASQALLIPSTSYGRLTFVCVMKLSGTVGEIVTTGSDAAATGGYLYGSSGSTIYCNRAGTSSQKNLSSNWAVDDVAKTVAWTFDGTHAGHRLYIGGQLQSLSNGVNTSDPGVAETAKVTYLAANQSGAAPSTGDYGEVIGLTTDASQSVVSRLSNRCRAAWGV